MALDRGVPVLPPADLDRRALRLRSLRPRVWWRIHRASLGPCYFSQQTANRLSSPGTAVIYLGEDPLTAFWEIFWDDLATRPPDERRIGRAKLNARRLRSVKPKRTFRVLDATNPRTLNLLSAPAGTFSGPYPVCQAWAAAIAGHPARPDGILYLSARQQGGRCLALFGDRVDCAAFRFDPATPVGDSPAIVDSLSEYRAKILSD
jgi:RES domain